MFMALMGRMGIVWGCLTKGYAYGVGKFFNLSPQAKISERNHSAFIAYVRVSNIAS